MTFIGLKNTVITERLFYSIARELENIDLADENSDCFYSSYLYV